MKQCVILLGGHLSPAQAVAEYCKRNRQDVTTVFIGRKTAFVEQTESTEEKVMSRISDVHLIDPPRGLMPWQWFNIVQALFEVLKIYLSYKPNAVVCFGSYVAFPGVIAAIILRIPIIVHEQTKTLSRMNHFVARFAKKVCVNEPDVLVPSYESKKVITGFPLRPSLFDPIIAAAYPIPSGIPVILIMGGTTGAVSLNELIFPIVDRLVVDNVVVQLTGEISYQKALSVRQRLPSNMQSRYIVSPYVSSDTMRWLYHQTTVAVSRSGANTVYELLAFQIASIFLPLPWSHNHEQQQLAEWFVSEYSGYVLDQKKIHSEEIVQKLAVLLQQHKQKNLLDTNQALIGTKKLVEAILS